MADKKEENYRKWYLNDGRKFCLKAGIKPGARVFEFGAGPGTYTVALSQAAGNKGVIYAAECDKEKLKELKEKIKTYRAENVRIYNTKGKIKAGFGEEFDFALVYDTAHYFGKDDRKRLYKVIYGILKKGGVFSLFPKHRLNDPGASGDFGKMGWLQIKKEVLDSGFKYHKTVVSRIPHAGKFKNEKLMHFTK
jgi:predicted methyltransferase